MSTIDSAIAEVVSCCPVTAEAQVYTWVSSCGIFGGQSCTGTGFSPSSLVFLCQYHSTVALYTHISPRGWIVGLLGAVAQRRCLAPWHEHEQQISYRVCGLDSAGSGWGLVAGFCENDNAVLCSIKGREFLYWLRHSAPQEGMYRTELGQFCLISENEQGICSRWRRWTVPDVKADMP
jgi:hypothetical protein